MRVPLYESVRVPLCEGPRCVRVSLCEGPCCVRVPLSEGPAELVCEM